MKYKSRYRTTLAVWLIVCLAGLIASCKPTPVEIEEDVKLPPKDSTVVESDSLVTNEFASLVTDTSDTTLLPMAYQIGAILYNPSAPGTLNIEMTGHRLYEADKIELLLRNRKGRRYRITPVSYAADGQTMIINLPSGIEPSQYSTQLLRRGKLVAVYDRFLVQTKSRTQPQIIELFGAILRGNPDKPIQIEYGKEYGFQYVITQNSTNVVVLLRSVENPSKTFPFAVDQKTVDRYNRMGPEFGLPRFTIPQSVPAGRYKLILEFIDKNEKLIEGDPLERDIEVR